MISLRHYQQEVQTHLHEDYCQIILPATGSLSLNVGGSDYSVGAGKLALIPACYAHAFASDTTDPFCVLDIPVTTSRQKLLSSPQICHLSNDLQALMPYFYHLARQDYHRKIYAEQAITLFLMHLQTQLSVEALRHVPERVQKIQSYIQDNLTHALSVPQISREVGISVSHLYHLCQTYLNKTPRDLVRQARVARAEIYLRTYPQHPLIHIALACGFSDQSHFSRVFKQYKGITPSQFRKSCFLNPPISKA